MWTPSIRTRTRNPFGDKDVRKHTTLQYRRKASAMKTVFVIANDGTRLMPTNIKRARRLMKRREAVICRHDPFTIKLTRDSEHNVQDIEFKQDTGDKHIGISVCSEKHEYISAQYDPLKDETKKHNDQRKYRRTRRNRRRYRKPRFDNRKKDRGWFAPSIEHKKELHVRLFEKYNDVCPIKKAVFEVGSYDIHAMQEYEQNGAVLTGTDYQKGPRYGMTTLREAVLYHQNYICPLCRKSLIGARTAIHHRGFRTGDRSNRLNNLMAVHAWEHTSANHKPGGLLWDIKPDHRPFKGAAFMNIVRKAIADEIEKRHPNVAVIRTYGAETKLRRQDLHIRKSHANDAYAMGEYHPKHRSQTMHFQKHRRNNRILSKFYDSKYIDVRDGRKKSGAELSCGRTNRCVPRNNPENNRVFRGQKLAKGRVSVRRRRYPINSEDAVIVNRKKLIASGTAHYGEYVHFGKGHKDVKTSQVRIRCHAGGWVQI